MTNKKKIITCRDVHGKASQVPIDETIEEVLKREFVEETVRRKCI